MRAFPGLIFPAAAGWVFFALFLPGLSAAESRICLASYNVENLFDLKTDGNEYPGYKPGGDAGWNRRMLRTKLGNLSRVIDDLAPDILALQEIESALVLDKLNRSLEDPYSYRAFSEKGSSSVSCALLSRYPVSEQEEIEAGGKASRSILKAVISISGSRLVVFVNHWKAKTGPESRRVQYARALRQEIEKLGRRDDFVVVGDLNSNYNEFKTFSGNPRLNDTGGLTGINHVLRTLCGSELVDERTLKAQPRGCRSCLYNLWLELKPSRRWSAKSFSRKSSPDHIIVSAGLYDGKGISYVDNSFDKFDPGYLFEMNRIFRWQRAERGRGRHLGKGFSDHLPVFACFSDSSFRWRAGAPYPLETLNTDDLYSSKTGRVNYRLYNCAVIYTCGEKRIIKQPEGRAVLLYKASPRLEKGFIYNLTVKYMRRYYGNLEITEIASVEKAGKADYLDSYLIEPDERPLSEPCLVNEVLKKVEGVYRRGWLYCGRGRKIRVYSPDRDLLPQSGSRIELSRVRIACHRHPELVLESPAQISRASKP